MRVARADGLEPGRRAVRRGQVSRGGNPLAFSGSIECGTSNTGTHNTGTHNTGTLGRGTVECGTSDSGTATAMASEELAMRCHVRRIDASVPLFPSRRFEPNRSTAGRSAARRLTPGRCTSGRPTAGRLTAGRVRRWFRKGWNPLPLPKRGPIRPTRSVPQFTVTPSCVPPSCVPPEPSRRFEGERKGNGVRLDRPASSPTPFTGSPSAGDQLSRRRR